MKNYVLIDVDDEGKFVQDPMKVLYIEGNTNVLFRFIGKLLENIVPVLLTNFDNKKNKKTIWEENDNQRLSWKLLQENYNIFEFTYDMLFERTCSILFKDSGTFSFQVIFLEERKKITDDSLYINAKNIVSHLIVNPVIGNDEIVPFKSIKLESITLITLFPSMMGKIETWENQLENLIVQRGYNGFHFSPIQQPGYSRSLYSIKDFGKPNLEVFGDVNNFSELKNIISRLKTKYQCFFMIDVLFNHCSADSEWILQEKNSYYSPSNTSHLKIAYELDKKLYELSAIFDSLLLLNENKIKSGNDVDCIINYIKCNLLDVLDIKKYYLIDIDKLIESFEKYIWESFQIKLPAYSKKLDYIDLKKFDELESLTKNLGKDFYGVTFEMAQLKVFFDKHFREFGRLEIEKVLLYLNSIFVSKILKWEQEILESIRGEITYRFIYMKIENVSSQYPLVQRYFVELPNNDVAASNGWILDYTEQIDFAESSENYYLRRKINIWTDLIKIRYSSEEITPLLWEKMKNYCSDMAVIFDALRIDNFHNSKLEIVAKFIDLAKQKNKNLLIMAELFLPSPLIFCRYVVRGGIHWVVGELQHYASTESLLEFYKRQQFSSKTKLSLARVLPIQLQNCTLKCATEYKPDFVCYDKTHDNPTSFSKFETCFFQVPLSVLTAFFNKPVGTVRGYDEMWTDFITVTTSLKYKEENTSYHDLDTSYVLITVDANSLINFNSEIYYLVVKGNFNNWTDEIVMQKSSLNEYSARVPFVSKIQFMFCVNNTSLCCSSDFEIEKNSENILVNVYEPNIKTVIHENLISARKMFNQMHVFLSEEYPLITFEHIDQETAVIQRFKEDLKEGYAAICSMNFDKNCNDRTKSFCIKLQGQIKDIASVFSVDNHSEKINCSEFPYLKLNILEEKGASKYLCVPPKKKLKDSQCYENIFITDIPINSAIILKTQFSQFIMDTIEELNRELFLDNFEVYKSLFEKFSIEEINYYLYSCEEEERARFNGYGNYYLENFGVLPFAGFAGLAKIFEEISLQNDKDHPIYENLMNSHHLIDFYRLRLERYQKYPEFLELYNNISNKIKIIPSFLIPKYFHQFISLLNKFIEESFLNKISTPKKIESFFFYKKLLTSLPQFLTSAEKPIINENYNRIENINKSDTSFSDSYRFYKENTLYLPSAGLPYFSVGCWKNWGRDTFISFKGLFLATGLRQQGKMIILHYARYLRHGLIPNLLSQPRYNSRDAVWWFLKSINDYVMQYNDFEILNERIDMLFLSDNQEEDEKMKMNKESVSIPLIDVMQRIFQSHCYGIKFREWDAPKIDDNMNSEGFNISLHVDWYNGFVCGGSKYNGLTWMDKVGSSEKAKNKGIPATPRYGAPIELTALLYLGVKFMDFLYKKGVSSHQGVFLHEGRLMAYAVWKNLIKANFEKFYWIPHEIKTPSLPELEGPILDINKIFRKGIYKDCYSGSKNDYKLRPNALIALTLVPNLLTPENMESHYIATKVLVVI